MWHATMAAMAGAPRWSVPLLAAVIGAQALAGVAGTQVVASDPYPKEWDPRIAELAEFVEDERGLEFDHPVEVEFLTDEEFRAEVTTDEAELTDQDREEMDQFVSIYRALGLVEGEVDLLGSMNQLGGEGIVGLYDYETETIIIRGTELTPEVRVTTVHELTHALQDQHFDIGEITAFETEGEASAFRAVVEGDADRVENGYIDAELSDEEYEELTDFSEDAGEEATQDVPPVLVSLFSAPYALGAAFLELVISEGGNRARNEVLRDPPVSDEQLLDPWTYLDDDDPVPVELPDLEDGAEAIEQDTDDFGSVSWYLVLAQRMDPRKALRAVDGWGGDAAIAYELDGTVCVQARFEGDDEGETSEMGEALDEWVGAGPDGTATVEREEGGTLLLRSCDPGDDAVPAFTGGDLLSVPLVRTFSAAGALEMGAPSAVARCGGDVFLDLVTVEQLLDETGESFQQADMEAMTQQVAQRCADAAD